MSYSDPELINMIEEIDMMGVDVSDWEADFIESILERRPTILSLKQREVVNKMIERFLR